MKNDVNHFVMFADVFRRDWHEFIYYITEEVDIASRVVSYSIDKVCHGLLVLNSPSEENLGIPKTAHLGDVFQVDDQHLLFAVGDP